MDEFLKKGMSLREAKAMMRSEVRAIRFKKRERAKFIKESPGSDKIFVDVIDLPYDNKRRLIRRHKMRNEARDDRNRSRSVEEKAAYEYDIKQMSERLGEAATDAVMKQKFGITECLYTGSGNRVVDKVYEGPNGEIFIVEAKGGAGKLCNKMSPNGVMLEQGSREYLEQTLDEMMTNGDAEDKNIATLAKDAMAKNKVRYLYVKQPLDKNGNLLPIIQKEFDITKTH